MASVLGWLDHSEKERREMQDVLALFRDKGTRDELGIGVIRDGISDLLFPGLSTVQTRARYFLLVPWCYLDLERRRKSSAQADGDLRWVETRLIKSLIKGESGTGVIGREAGRSVQRLPSNIYWSGLSVFGIRLTDGSQADYARSLDGFYRANDHRSNDADQQELASNWNSNLPPVPKNLWEETSLQLSHAEATYLADRILLTQPRSLLAHFVSVNADGEDHVFPWQVPSAWDSPPEAQAWLRAGEGFSATMHGAAIYYNRMLAHASGRTDLVETYDDLWDKWARGAVESRSEVNSWSLDELWPMLAKVRVAHLAKRFVTSWTHIAQSGSFDPNELDSLIRSRERQLKGPQARIGNARAIEQWQGGAGDGRLSYRWLIARNILSDIKAGRESA